MLKHTIFIKSDKVRVLKKIIHFISSLNILICFLKLFFILLNDWINKKLTLKVISDSEKKFMRCLMGLNMLIEDKISLVQAEIEEQLNFFAFPKNKRVE